MSTGFFFSLTFRFVGGEGVGLTTRTTFFSLSSVDVFMCCCKRGVEKDELLEEELQKKKMREDAC